MTDFEIQRRLREMNTPLPPQNDLWAGIVERIAAEDAAAPITRHRRNWLPLAAAAALLVSVVTGTLVLGLHQTTPDFAANESEAVSPQKMRAAMYESRGLARAPGGDPRLVGAAVVLDSAHAELEQALEQRPDAVFLVSLLNRTNARRMKLDHFGANAG